MKPSGKFVLRLPPSLHAELKREAEQQKCSLNQLILNKLSDASPTPADGLLRKIKKEWAPLAVVLFGSTARGEAHRDSDVDLLIVLPRDVRLDRSLYHTWDRLFSRSAPQHSPQFVHLPENLDAVGGLWLEAALDGQILYSESDLVPSTLRKLKNLIARGDYIRKVSHGHGYWVKRKD